MCRSPLIVSLLTMLALILAAGRALGQDCARPPDRICELANSDDEIFTGRVLSAMHENGAIRVQVLHVYRGGVSGEIFVGVSPLWQKFKEGETYLFFTSRDRSQPDSLRENEPCISKPISLAGPDELAFLSSLGGGLKTGSVFGKLAKTVNFVDLTPLPGIAIVLKSEAESYSVTTDTEGKFEILDLPAGVYKVSVAVPNTLRLFEDDEFTIYPHGCMPEDLYALNNASISGRITLPKGITVEGTKVSAISLTGHANSATQADSQGRYKIEGLAPGEYIVGIIRDTAPSVNANYPQSYFSATTNREEAKKFVISGADHFADVDIEVPTAWEVVKFKVKATFEDGRPVTNQAINLSYDGMGQGHGSRTDSDGIASLSAVKGEEFYVVGLRMYEVNQGQVDSQCLSPVKLGPVNYPQMIHVVYSQDGCRNQSNVEGLGQLRAHARGKLSEVKITVAFPDGTPAAYASVSILGKKGANYFGGGFLTDRNGDLDLPVPEDEEFNVSGNLHQPETHCGSKELTFNTENGIRWRETSSAGANSPAWNNVTGSTALVHLVLTSTQCQPNR
jgi:hypothetical protein